MRKLGAEKQFDYAIVFTEGKHWKVTKEMLVSFLDKLHEKEMKGTGKEEPKGLIK